MYLNLNLAQRLGFYLLYRSFNLHFAFALNILKEPPKHMFKAVFGLADVKKCKLETVAIKWNGQYCLVLQPSQGKRG